MESKNNILCCGCLSSGRKMLTVNEYWVKHCFLQIISEIPMFQPVTEPVSLCWECEAQMRKFTKFKQKVKHSYSILNVKQETIHIDIDTKPRLSVHKLSNLSIINTTENIETLFEVNALENNVLDENNDAWADTHSDDEKLIKIRMKKVINGKVKKRKKKICEVKLCGEDEYHIKEETEKCENCHTLFDNKNEINYHVCIKQEAKHERNVVNGKIKKKKRKSNEMELFTEVELSRDDLEEERRLAMLKDDYVNAMFKCERCIVCFANSEDLQDHISLKHELNSSNFKCDICECSFASEVSYNYHANRHVRRYECGACSTLSCSRHAAAKHYEQYHSRGTVLDIDLDSGQNDDNTADGEDNGTKQLESSFPCEFCSKSFRWKTSLRKHVETHRIETGQKRKPYCEPCGLSFTTTSNLQKHVKTSSKHQIQLKLRKLKETENATSPEKEQDRIDQIKCSVNRAKQVFPCPQCDKKFQWRGNMLRHVNSHAARAKGELVCEPCNRKFSSIATYKQHMKISKRHVSENDFKYMCSDCGKRFATKTRLKDHINWEHVKKYVHTCSVCQKNFKSHNSLYLHKQVVHKKDNAEHLCHHCGKAFPNQAKLLAHMRAAHSGGAPHACAKCGARFSWLSCLSRHQRRKHQEHRPTHRHQPEGEDT